MNLRDLSPTSAASRPGRSILLHHQTNGTAAFASHCPLEPVSFPRAKNLGNLFVAHDSLLSSSGFVTNKNTQCYRWVLFNFVSRKSVKNQTFACPQRRFDIVRVTVMHGANGGKEDDRIISCASCTTNSVTPVVELLGGKIGVKKMMLTSVHAYTATQGTVDSPSKKWRRGRTAAANIAPTTPGAAIATTKALPRYEGKFDGVALRVPVTAGSISDITFVTERPTSVDEVNNVFLRGPHRLIGHHYEHARLDRRAFHDEGGRWRPRESDGVVRQRMGIYLADGTRGRTVPRRADSQCRVADPPRATGTS